MPFDPDGDIGKSMDRAREYARKLRVKEKAEKDALVEKAMARAELERRMAEQRLLYYRPCCRVHHPLPCPRLACPDSKHAQFHADPAQTRVIFGGNRSSKTFTCRTETTLQFAVEENPFTGARAKAGWRGRVWAPSFSLIEKEMLPKFFEWIPKASLGMGHLPNRRDAFEKSWDSRYNILHLAKDGMLDFMSYDQDLGKAESVELDWAWADEEMPEEYYSATQARLLTRKGRMIMSVTPLYRMSWAIRFWETTQADVSVYKFSVWDNPHNDEAAIRTFLANVPEHEREARENGTFMEFQGLVYKELSPQVHRIRESRQPKPHYPVVMAMDPHPRKPTVITWAYVDEAEDVVFFDELEIAGTAKEIARAIKAKEASHKARTVLRLIDPAAKAQGSNLAAQTDTLREFAREGMGFTLADNSEAGYNVVHSYLAWDRKKELSALNRPRCYFTKDAPLTWFGMTHLMWDEWSTRRTLKDEKEHVRDYKKDFPDCVRYTLAARPRYLESKLPTSLTNSKEFRAHKKVREIVFGRRTHDAGR